MRRSPRAVECRNATLLQRSFVTDSKSDCYRMGIRSQKGLTSKILRSGLDEPNRSNKTISYPPTSENPERADYVRLARASGARSGKGNKESRRASSIMRSAAFSLIM